MFRLSYCMFVKTKFLSLFASAILAALFTHAQAETYSLARDFSYTNNGTNSTWSYRLDDSKKRPPVFPLLTLTNRDANVVWGSNFPKPPTMWSEGSGYWGIAPQMRLSPSTLPSERSAPRWRQRP